MARDKFLVYGSPRIGKEEIDAVASVMESGWLGTGPIVKEFEAGFSEYTGAKYCLALSSCTAALHLALLACGIGEGDEVITTPMTFCATVNSIIHARAKPVLVDIDPDTMNLDASAVEAAITDHTRAIIPVHFAGYPCNMDELAGLCRRYDLFMIEDCAHAIETLYNGKHAGTFGTIGCFSFYVTKNLVTGEGGMLITDDESIAERARILSLHGMSKDAWRRFGDQGYSHYEVIESGYKYNMMDIQAAIGLCQLARIDENWSRRLKVWTCYDKHFSDLPVKRPKLLENDTGRHGLHLYTFLINPEEAGINRDDFIQEMTARNIGTGVHYRSIPEHTFYRKKYNWDPQDWPFAYDVGQQTVSIPLSANLDDTDVNDVIEAVYDIFGKQ